MKREEIFMMAQQIFSVEPEYLWEGETHAVLRHPQNKKWFAILMDVKKKVLHLSDEETDGEEFEQLMNVKLNPTLIEDLLHEDEFIPAYHMNKKYWISLRTSRLSEETIKKFLEASWDSVKPKVKKAFK